MKETGDLGDPRRARARATTHAGSETPLHDHLRRSHRLHARPARASRAAAHRAGRLERLPEPQLLLGDARRFVPDAPQRDGRHRRVRLHRRHSSCWRQARRRIAGIAARRRGRGRTRPASRDGHDRGDRAHGWDGAWFRRAYDSYGRPVGSAANDEGQIYIEPQGLCVMAGIGLEDGRHASRDRVRPRAAGDAARDRAAAARLLELPPRARRDLLVPARLQGERRHLLPHEPVDDDRRGASPATATVRSTTTCGSTRRPARRSRDVHRCEPYVYAQMIAGREAPTHGEAKNSWLTGTAAWNLVAISQWILGIRPEHDGLRVEPAAPERPGRASVRRGYTEARPTTSRSCAAPRKTREQPPPTMTRSRSLSTAARSPAPIDPAARSGHGARAGRGPFGLIGPRARREDRAPGRCLADQTVVADSALTRSTNRPIRRSASSSRS